MSEREGEGEWEREREMGDDISYDNKSKRWRYDTAKLDY